MIYTWKLHGFIKKEERKENLCEKVITENFPNPVKKTDIQVQEMQSLKQDELEEDHTKTHNN